MTNKLVTILRSAVEDAIDDRDVTCAVLSGGLDSSTVVSLAPYDIPTFTGYYDYGPLWDEREWAWLVARGDHVDVRIEPTDLVDHFDAYAKSVAHLADPQGLGGFGQYMVAQAIAAHGFTCVLSGEGADELFGGYFRANRLAESETVPEAYKLYEPPAGYPTDHESALAYDLERLPALLAVDDAVLSANGLIGRAPFTDQRVVDYALALPASERIWKRHLRAAVRGIVPDGVVDRTDKMGFPAPFARWAQVDPVRSFVLDRIGYVPDRRTPYARGWWHDLIRASV